MRGKPLSSLSCCAPSPRPDLHPGIALGCSCVVTESPLTALARTLYMCERREKKKAESQRTIRAPHSFMQQDETAQSIRT